MNHQNTKGGEVAKPTTSPHQQPDKSTTSRRSGRNGSTPEKPHQLSITTINRLFTADNKVDRLRNYIDAKVELENCIEQERNLTMSMPRFLGAIRITGPEDTGPAMKSDPEIEAIGMRKAMEYERDNGRIPEDVSSENLGFDVRSTDDHGKKRYIEVKARAKIGEVDLTHNEWFKAKRFRDDYYLYVVYNAATIPELHVVRDPWSNLTPEERIEVVRFIIKSQEIIEKEEDY